MNTESPYQLLIDSSRLARAIEESGYSSVREFAEVVGLHRNTIGNYLSGEATLPDGLARILAALDVEVAEAIRLVPPPRRVVALAVSPLIDDLHEAWPRAAVVLFGSRARGRAKPLSDYDLGVFAEEHLPFENLSRLLDMVGEWNERSMTIAQLTDLGRADDEFLRRIAPDLVFLAGSMRAWRELLQRAGLQIHE